ncbi:amino acid permease [Gluconobacter sp. GP1]|uniref:APC family permease n=1 Tax=Gluconobacter sp. GP1 TaxID=3046423 RepID=UPI00293F0B29|nr:amino acid permease [Gluconobacter sp. GP1]
MPLPIQSSSSASATAARRKSLEQIMSENEAHGLKRSLTATQLILLGVGSTIGAGIYVMTGTAAAEYAGPSVLVSFVVAALACLFTAFSYGELSSTLPVSGSAYSYAYISMGEKVAWIVGWLLLLEYGISCAAVAAGLSGYASSLLAVFGIHIPASLTQATLQPVPGSDGTAISAGWRLDLIGLTAVFLVTGLLVRGIEESARVNTLIVILKVGVLGLFVAFGIHAIHPANWHPFIPPNEGGFHYGVKGIFRAASIIFFAYVGFEAVSTASAEAKNPTRDVPIGIIGSLLICTIVYIIVAAVLLGIVPYRDLDVPDPLAIAVRVMNTPWLSIFINVGATIGLCSVLMGLMYAQSRVLMTMSRDGLIPSLFGKVHTKFRTPWLGTIVLGIIVAIMTATLPIDIISDLVSIGTAAAFGIVCFTVIWQRNTRPDLHRPFSVPLGGFRVRGFWIGITPLLGIIFCLFMTIPLVTDMIHSVANGNPVPLILLTGYVILGIVTYVFYGRRNSTMAG